MLQSWDGLEIRTFETLQRRGIKHRRAAGAASKWREFLAHSTIDLGDDAVGPSSFCQTLLGSFSEIVESTFSHNFMALLKK